MNGQITNRCRIAFDKLKYLVRLDIETNRNYDIDQAIKVEEIQAWFAWNGMYLSTHIGEREEARNLENDEVLLSVDYTDMECRDRNGTEAFFQELEAD